MNANLVRHVNFLEAKPSVKESFSLNYFWIITIIAVFSLTAGGYSYWQSRQIKALQEELEKTSAEVAGLKTTQSEREAASVSGKALKEVLNDPVVWSTLVKKIAKKIPESVKLSEISGSILDQRTLIIKGTSSYLLPILRLKDNLVSLTECEKAALISVEQSRGDNGKEPISFHLECKLL